MDWDYLVSLNPDDLDEEEKDNLYNTVTWFDSAGEVLDAKKSMCFIRICQEVLKYKGEQVEIVLHKLDELATQQAEDEEEKARKMSADFDAEVSTKSRKSSSIEFDNLEQKYIDMKNKYKKQVKIHEKDLVAMKKLQARITDLEQEKNRLLVEMQSFNQDDQSDVSESVKDQQKELIATIHNKNKQISGLLRDIEETERENTVLREKLTKTRDELSTATKELTTLTENLKSYEKQIKENSEEITKLTVERDSLQEEIRELLEQKRKFEQEMEEFTEEVNIRVDDWKTLLRDKEKEIELLKSHGFSRHSSLVSLTQDKEHMQLSTLNKILSERERQLMEVKSKLQTATKEMEDTTLVIKKLHQVKTENESQIADLNISVSELKKQLAAAHGRCQDLQDELTHVEKIASSKDADIKEILEKMKQEGKGDLAVDLEQIQKLKAQVRVYEKQIMDLVKNVNKLQDICDTLEKDNNVLRDKLGIDPEETLDTSAFTLKQKQRIRELNHLKSQLSKLEEENLQLRMELRKIHSTDVKIDSGVSKNDQLKALVEENEALRRGMHEILDSLKNRKENSLKEIRSETLEMLLRALDVKHISGWYHPAMRLQAELHNQEGINSELREQLRLVRLELQHFKENEQQAVPVRIIDTIDGDNVNNIQYNLQTIFSRLEYETKENEKTEGKLLKYQENFQQIQQQVILLYDEYNTEKTSLNEKIAQLEQEKIESKDKNRINEEQLALFLNDTDSEHAIIQKSLQLIETKIELERKCDFLENEVKKSLEHINVLQKDQSEAQLTCMKKISVLNAENKSLQNQVEKFTNQLESSVDLDSFKSIKTELENTTLKYRGILADLTKIAQDKSDEIKMLEEMRKNLLSEKGELTEKILNLSEQLHKKGSDSEDVEKLSQKLAASEVNEITERQRANHTNNLYELVKEQLQKSEERFKHVESYNKELLLKNVSLQEQLAELERKLADFVVFSAHEVLQKKYRELLDKNNNLAISLEELKQKSDAENMSVKFVQSWNTDKENELLNLKHQIVDLQSVSDDKSQIARLLNEVSGLKLQQKVYTDKIEALQQELSDTVNNYQSKMKNYKEKYEELGVKEQELKTKLRILKEVLSKYKLQYLGSVPLSSEEKFIENIKKAVRHNHEAFLNLYNAHKTCSDSSLLKEQYEMHIINKKSEHIDEISDRLKDPKLLQLNEMKYRRECELKEVQLRLVFDRVKIQDEQIIKLEEELFRVHANLYCCDEFDSENASNIVPKQIPTELPLFQVTKARESQTDDAIINEDSAIKAGTVDGLRTELLNSNNELALREQQIAQLKSKITENEMNISLFRKQLGDKQSQIQFYERHILELQNKKELANEPDESSTSEEVTMNDEIISLKCSLKSCQDDLRQKEEELLRYESLLKEDRDKHSMAATLMRDELKVLQKCLAEEKQHCQDLKTSFGEIHPGKAALEQYFVQVHSLEDELSVLRTKVSTLETQIQASRVESVRWRTLANDRLESMQKLGEELENVHGNEIETYKSECEKWRDEVTNLKHLISKYRSEAGHEFDIQRLIKEKDDKIHELSVMLRHTKMEVRKNTAEKLVDSESLTRLNEAEAINEQLSRELQTIKKRFEQLMVERKNAREEIRELKGKLMKKPVISSARSDKSDRSIKEQLQKKIASMESEMSELKEELAKQIAQNESHRIKISEDFDRWNKQKHWQQTAERLKTKLKAKESDFEKLQQTCSGYRMLIERLEREKYNMESRIRNLRSVDSHYNFNELELLRMENMKLNAENDALSSKLEMQQHHSGGLGAAMLQEKLEGQERKIAILELTSKGTVEVRAELERLQSSISTLQKRNLCLEAENLDLKLDLEKCTKEVPHLRNQIQHLENYIEVLKKENVTAVEAGSSATELGGKAENKKAHELERTIFVLKRVVEKLQNENKRLVAGKRPLFSDRSNSAEKLRRDYQRLKQQYCENLEKVEQLEKELAKAKINQSGKPSEKPISENVAILTEQLSEVKEQLEQKTQLLNRVRVLLQRAAVKEKALLHEIQELKQQSQNTNET